MFWKDEKTKIAPFKFETRSSTAQTPDGQLVVRYATKEKQAVWLLKFGLNELDLFTKRVEEAKIRAELYYRLYRAARYSEPVWIHHSELIEQREKVQEMVLDSLKQKQGRRAWYLNAIIGLLPEAIQLRIHSEIEIPKSLRKLLYQLGGNQCQG